MQLLKSEFMQKHWPLLLTLLWLVFAASTRVAGLILDADQRGCDSVENGPYWLFVTYSWPAFISTLMTVPILLLILGRMNRDRLRDWSVSYKLGMAAVMLIAQIIACYSALISLVYAPFHQSTLRTEQQIYHLAVCSDAIDYYTYHLYECDLWDTQCSEIHYYACRGTVEGCTSKMRVSSDGSELHLFRKNWGESGLEDVVTYTYPLDD